ncbi:HpcH/HpaI aldolase/citrate lyase family protein [Thermovibrio sp.]
MEELFQLAREVLEGKRSLEELKSYPESLKERREVENPFKRSALIVSGDRVEHLKKALDREADVLILNLEDGVSPERKSFARTLLRKFLINSSLKGDKEVIVRVNPIDSPYFWDDVTELLPALPHGFRLSKVNSPEDVIAVSRLLTAFEASKGLKKGFFKLQLSIETPSALLNLSKILSSSSRIDAAYLGILDLFASLGLSQKLQDKRLGLYLRERFAFECRSFNISPIAPAYQDYKDLEGFKREAELEKELGFFGKMAISVRQSQIALSVFSPSEEELKEAKEIVEVYEKALKEGKGGVPYKGTFVDQPIYKDALNKLRFS